ncbi:hypothetical protein ScPMuIL_002071, partial [Solemya velum]
MVDRSEFLVDGRLLSDLRVIDLKKECDKRSLSKSGSKNQIKERLKAQILAEEIAKAGASKEKSQSELKADNEGSEIDFIKQYREAQQHMIEVHRLSQSEGSQSESDAPIDSPEKGSKRSAVTTSSKSELDDTQESKNMPRSRRRTSRHSDKHEKETEDRSRDRKDRMSSGRIARGKDLWEEGEIEDRDDQVESQKQDEKDDSISKEDKKETKKDNSAKNKTKEQPEKRDTEQAENKKPVDNDEESLSAIKGKEHCKLKETSVGVESKPVQKANVKPDSKSKDHPEVGLRGKETREEQMPDRRRSQDSKTSLKEMEKDELQTDELTMKDTKLQSKDKPVDTTKGGKDHGQQKEDGEITEETKNKSLKSRSRSSSISSSKSRSRSRSVSKSDDERSPTKSHQKEFRSASESEDEKPKRRSQIQKRIKSVSDSVDEKKKVPEPQKSRSSSRSSRSRSRSTSASSRRSRSRSKSSSSERSKSRSRSRSKSKSKTPKGTEKCRSGDNAANLKHDDNEEKVLAKKKVEFTPPVSEPKEEGELSQDSEEKITPRPSHRISLTGRMKRSSLNDSDNKEASPKDREEKPVRKRKWGSSTSKSPKKTTSMAISTDSLKGLIPEIAPNSMSLPVAFLDLDNNAEMVFSDHEEDKRDVKIRRTVVQHVKEEQGNGEKSDNSEEEEEEEEEEEKKTKTEPESHTKTKVVLEKKEKKKELPKVEPKTVRQISRSSILNEPDEPTAARRSPSPPKKPVNRVIHIANLVRPFTIGQLQELLKRSGTLTENGFWIDKIKSHCYVSYETEDQASAARKALHGTKWPVSNPKILHVEFATKDELEFHQFTNEGVSDKPVVKPTKSPKKKEVEKEREKVAEKRVVKKKEEPKPIREWDRGKVIDNHSREREQLDSDRRDRGRGRSPSPRDRRRRSSNSARSGDREKRDRKEKKVEEEPPAKLLDDLFRKTKTTPCIYWLPLTETRIVEREKEKQQRTLERDKRRKEMEEKEKQTNKSRRSGSPEQRPSK